MTDTTAKISLIITSRPAVFRRAGFAFTREAQTISLEKLGAVKARQLLTEPELVWQLELRSADTDKGTMLAYMPDHIDVIAAYADGDIGDDEFALAISGPPPQEPDPEPTPAPEPAPQEKQPAPKPSDKPVKPAKTPARSPPRKPSAKAD